MNRGAAGEGGENGKGVSCFTPAATTTIVFTGLFPIVKGISISFPHQQNQHLNCLIHLHLKSESYQGGNLDEKYFFFFFKSRLTSVEMCDMIPVGLLLA